MYGVAEVFSFLLSHYCDEGTTYVSCNDSNVEFYKQLNWEMENRLL